MAVINRVSDDLCGSILKQIDATELNTECQRWALAHGKCGFSDVCPSSWCPPLLFLTIFFKVLSNVVFLPINATSFHIRSLSVPRRILELNITELANFNRASTLLFSVLLSISILWTRSSTRKPKTPIDQWASLSSSLIDCDPFIRRLRSIYNQVQQLPHRVLSNGKDSIDSIRSSI